MSLSTFLKIGSALPLATGAGDVLLGSKFLETAAGPFPVDKPSQVFADSQIRFLGAMWGAWSPLLWWISEDIKNRRVPLAICGASLVVGGFGRAVSGARHGYRPGFVLLFTLVEIFVPPLVWLFADW